MNRQSVKNARRSSKVARRTVKKSAKSVRSSVKKASKSARRTVGKSKRPVRSVAVRSPSVAPKAGAGKPSGKLTKMIRTLSPPVQPIAAPDLPVHAHKYQVGEAVYFTSPTFGRAAAIGTYTVVKLLPSESDDYQYRIKSSGEAFERVAKESQLDRA